MNFKNIVLSVVIILGSCSDSLLVAQSADEQSEMIENAKDTFDELKKAVKCVFRKKGCDEKKRKEIIVKGLKVLGVVAVLTTGAIWKFKPLSPAAAKKSYEGIENTLLGTRVKQTSDEIAAWIGTKGGEMTIDVVVIDRGNIAYGEKRTEAEKAYQDREYQEAYRLIREAEKTITATKERYEKELKKAEKARIQASLHGKEEE